MKRKAYKPKPVLNPLMALASYKSTKSYSLVAGQFMAFVDALKRGEMDGELWDNVAIYITALRTVAIKHKNQDAIDATYEYLCAMASILDRHKRTGRYVATGDELNVLGGHGDALIEAMATLPVTEVYKAEKIALSIEDVVRKQLEAA